MDLIRTGPGRAGDRSPSSSSATSWTSRPCSARSCSGCSPSSTTSCPRRATCPKPKLCFFFDEAHLLFDDASAALLQAVEQTARLIRSKGVGVYFVTQAPTDIPASILAQLGNRVEHALRAFTPQDADNLKKTVRTFPITTFYDVEATITSLGIGEALVTVLSPSGVPTPLAATRLIPPDSLMAALDPVQFQGRIATSPLTAKYAPGDRPGERPRDDHRPDRGGPAGGRRGRRGPGRRWSGRRRRGRAGGPHPGQQQREIQRQARELEKERQAAEREAKAQARAEAAAERERKAEERARQRSLDSAIRTGGRIVTSRTGQDLIRGVFGTLFGGKR